jgi:pyroglutamyl-peptidase
VSSAEAIAATLSRAHGVAKSDHASAIILVSWGAMRVLVTGFGPFGPHASNPSTDVAHALHGAEHEGVYFVAFAPLPVLYAEAATAACTAARHLGADAILALGLAATTTQVRVERRARNQATAAAADAAGRSCAGVLAEAGGEPALLTSLDADAIARDLVAAGLECVPSDDAGGYVCNDLYYRLLAAARRGEAPSRILFVHLPENAAEQSALPEALARAVARAIRVSL